MSDTNRPTAFWAIVIFLGFSFLAMLFGQTLAVFDYDLAVRLGLQESLLDVSEYGVQVNRAFGVGDTLVYIPLILMSLIGLIGRKRWSLLITAAMAGVSAYWSVTIASMLLLLRGAPGYNYVPGPAIWLFVMAFLVFGVWAFFYVLLRGNQLLR